MANESELSPLVSIIIPMYNSENYIELALESCFSQDYDNIEVIVVNDASSDRSSEFVKVWGSVKILENSKNMGNRYSMNRGAHAASGAFLKFLDADDVLDRSCIRNQVSKALGIEYAAVVYSPYLAIDVDSQLIDTPKREPDFSSSRDQLSVLLRDNLQTAASLYPRELFWKVGGFDEVRRFAADYDLNIRIAASGIKFERAGGISVYYRKHLGSISYNRWSAENLDIERSDWSGRLDVIRQLRGDQLTSDQQRFFSDIFFILARKFIAAGRVAEGYDLLQKSRELCASTIPIKPIAYGFFCFLFSHRVAENLIHVARSAAIQGKLLWEKARSF